MTFNDLMELTKNHTLPLDATNEDGEFVIIEAGSGEITLMVNQTIIELSDITEGLIIDSVLQEAYWNNNSMNHCMSGDFPRLQTGMNAISWSGNVTSVHIEPNWRYL